MLVLLLLIASGALAAAWGQLPANDNPFALIPLLLAAMGLGLRYSALAYLGDAARYLSPNPQNV
ncbi:hypothetical protein KQH89_02960, partial [Vibrio cholerae]|uniref:hypothetical protein n=1 Tax=Vibrio cholerae TaxID=666 RepID=UPI001C0FAC7B